MGEKVSPCGRKWVRAVGSGSVRWTTGTTLPDGPTRRRAPPFPMETAVLRREAGERGKRDPRITGLYRGIPGETTPHPHPPVSSGTNNGREEGDGGSRAIRGETVGRETLAGGVFRF